jgi:hypothetical protein
VFVQAGPNGENPTGSLVTSGFLNFSATPTCVNVVGHAAVAGFRIDAGTIPSPGLGFISSVQDNGPPVNGRPVDTTIYEGYLFNGAPTSCPAPGEPPPPDFADRGAGPFLSGDVTVVDAPALPTSKDQCKNGGWRNFGVFKNQGDCVSYVETGGKNRQAGG